MRNDVKKAIDMFDKNPLGLLIWVYCDYYKLSAQEFDRKAGKVYYYRLTKAVPISYHASTMYNVLSVVSLSRDQYAAFCVFRHKLKKEGMIPLPELIKDVVWIRYLFEQCLIRLFLDPPPWAIGYDEMRYKTLTILKATDCLENVTPISHSQIKVEDAHVDGHT